MVARFVWSRSWSLASRVSTLYCREIPCVIQWGTWCQRRGQTSRTLALSTDGSQHVFTARSYLVLCSLIVHRLGKDENPRGRLPFKNDCWQSRRDSFQGPFRLCWTIRKVMRGVGEKPKIFMQRKKKKKKKKNAEDVPTCRKKMFASEIDPKFFVQGVKIPLTNTPHPITFLMLHS